MGGFFFTFALGAQAADFFLERGIDEDVEGVGAILQIVGGAAAHDDALASRGGASDDAFADLPDAVGVRNIGVGSVHAAFVAAVHKPFEEAVVHGVFFFFVLLDDGSNFTVGSQLDDIRKFILGQPDSTRIGLAYMQNGVARIVQNLTSDHDAVAKALRLPVGSGGANGSPYFALSDLVKHWPAGAPRRRGPGPG